MITLKWVLPDELGLWNSILIIQAYLPILQIGIISGLNRELPYIYGKGKIDDVISLASTALYIVLIVIGLISICSMVILLTAAFNSIEYFSIIGVVILTNITLYSSYVNVSYRANQSFMVLSKINYIMGFLYIISVIIPYLWDYEGYIVRLVFLALVLMIIIHKYNPIKVKPFFNFYSFKTLIKTGFTIYVLGYFQEITGTFSRIILLYLATIITIGYFSPSLSIYGGMMMIGSSVGQYLYPKMTFDYGKYGDSRNLWKWVWQSSALIIIISIPIILGAWILLPFLFNQIFPGYKPGLFAARIALISGTFESAAVIINVLATLKAWKYWFILSLIKILLFGSFIGLFGYFINPLDGVAIGQMVAQIFFFICVFYICYKVTVKEPFLDNKT